MLHNIILWDGVLNNTLRHSVGWVFECCTKEYCGMGCLNVTLRHSVGWVFEYCTKAQCGMWCMDLTGSEVRRPVLSIHSAVVLSGKLNSESQAASSALYRVGEPGWQGSQCDRADREPGTWSGPYSVESDHSTDTQLYVTKVALKMSSASKYNKIKLTSVQSQEKNEKKHGYFSTRSMMIYQHTTES